MSAHQVYALTAAPKNRPKEITAGAVQNINIYINSRSLYRALH